MTRPVRNAAADLRSRREPSQTEPVAIEYKNPQTGGPLEEKFSVDPRKAARDPSAYHRTVVEQAQNDADID